MSGSTPVPTNISAPEFIGPVVTDSSFYFICRVVYDDSIETSFDVTLTFDGEIKRDVPVRTVSSSGSLEATFTLDDFAGQFSKMVYHYMTCITLYVKLWRDWSITSLIHDDHLSGKPGNVRGF